MYNKLFTKILDSSIWLESSDVRVVWFTFLAAMNEDGFAQFASIANLAHRARVSEDAAKIAVESFESPDPNSGNPDNEGRRIERVPGGWIVLNHKEHRDMITKVVAREHTRIRVARHRLSKGVGNADCITGALPNRYSNASEAVSVSETDKKTLSKKKRESKKTITPTAENFTAEHAEKVLEKADLPFSHSDWLNFIDKSAANGYAWIDLDAAFRTWVRNDKKRDGNGTDGRRATGKTDRGKKEIPQRILDSYKGPDRVSD